MNIKVLERVNYIWPQYHFFKLWYNEYKYTDNFRKVCHISWNDYIFNPWEELQRDDKNKSGQNTK